MNRPTPGIFPVPSAIEDFPTPKIMVPNGHAWRDSGAKCFSVVLLGWHDQTSSTIDAPHQTRMDID